MKKDKNKFAPVWKAAAVAVLIIFVDLVSAACSQQSETLSLSSLNDTDAASAAVSAVSENGNTYETAPKTDAGEAASVEEVTPVIYVYVCGAVEDPGVYALAADARVFEAVEAAGGFSLDADETAVNQALVLQDQDQLYIPSTEETAAGSSYVQGTVTAGISGNITGIPEENRSVLVNINTASQAELETLPGIGSTKAAAILAWREENGSFNSIDDLKKVSGIGAATFEKLKNSITVGR